jgi:hypothetical protein
MPLSAEDLEVAAAAEEFEARESVCLECARSGRRDTKLYSEARREMLSRVAALDKHLRKGRAVP